jgi:hypothetical protein
MYGRGVGAVLYPGQQPSNNLVLYIFFENQWQVLATHLVLIAAAIVRPWWRSRFWTHF